MAFTTLEISDGTTTVSLLAGNAGLQLREGGWSPAVAPPIQSDLGGRGAWADVVERIEVLLTGSAGMTALYNLSSLLHQAERWARGEPVSAVYIRVLISAPVAGGTWQATILGPGRDMLEMPDDFGDLLIVGEVTRIRISFVRRGAWENTTPVEGSTGNQGPWSFTSVALFPRPVAATMNVRITPSGDTEALVGVLLLGQSTTAFTVLEAEMPSSVVTGYATFAAAAGAARGTSNNAIRYTQASTNSIADPLVYSVTPSLAVTAGVDVYVRVMNQRVTNANNPFFIQARLRMDSTEEFQGPWLAVPAIGSGLTNKPQIIHLGYFPVRGNIAQLHFRLRRTNGTVNDFIEFDFFTIHKIEDYSQAIAINNPWATASGEYLILDNTPAQAPYPRVELRTSMGALRWSVSYAGNPVIGYPPNASLVRLFWMLAYAAAGHQYNLTLSRFDAQPVLF